MKEITYGFSKLIDLSYEEAIEKVTNELKKEGFGILTEIDVKETLKKKLDVDVKPYKILGACNPPFAYSALQAEKQIGLLLPCNVIVYSENERQSVVAAIDPIASMQVVENHQLRDIAKIIEKKLKSVIERI
jgi:uncharacterized protein (DUF302 family)